MIDDKESQISIGNLYAMEGNASRFRQGRGTGPPVSGFSSAVPLRSLTWAEIAFFEGGKKRRSGRKGTYYPVNFMNVLGFGIDCMRESYSLDRECSPYYMGIIDISCPSTLWLHRVFFLTLPQASAVMEKGESPGRFLDRVRYVLDKGARDEAV